MTLIVTLHFLDAFLVLLLSFVADGVIGVKVEATTIILSEWQTIASGPDHPNHPNTAGNCLHLRRTWSR